MGLNESIKSYLEKNYVKKLQLGKSFKGGIDSNGQIHKTFSHCV